MSRYIDADALRADWLENGENEYVYDTNAFLDSIDNAPIADVVDVVRCRDCKYYQNGRIFEDIKFCFRLKNIEGKAVGYNWADNDFCSHGKRRECDDSD